jgi:PASTA domain
MAAGVIGRMPRVGVIACAICLLTGTLGYAASSTLTPPAAPVEPVAAAAPEPLVVPDVRKQAYVFAKGSLEQSGFAWRVTGSVPGFAANVVVSQSPAPGARVIADGTPTVVLQLRRNGAHEQEGVPENASPYAGTPARLVGGAEPSAPAPAQSAAPAAPKPAKSTPTKPKPKAAAASRKPAFAVAGAPVEPADEMLLSTRAKQLASWVEKHPQRTKAAVSHWLYQHSWIVTGASFGWAEGAAALRTLVAVDRRVQELWGVGADSERQARRALAEVSAKSR